MEEIPLDPPTTDASAVDAPAAEAAEATEATETTEAVNPPEEVVLSAEEQANLEKMKKRAERFGTALNIPENFKKPPKQTPPRNEKKKKELDESEIKKIEEREKRFGVIATKMRNDKHFDAKVENLVSEENKRRPEALHIYGVDFLSTEEIMAYFKTYNPKKIEWLNDSSCNMIFESENLAERAYKELTLTKNYDSVWRETFPIQKEGLKFTLEVRYATEKDVKDPNRREKSSSYYGFMFEQIREKKEKNKANRKDRGRDRDYYDRGSGIRNKQISKKGGKRGKKTREDEEEENDPELKKLRQQQAAEAENEAADGENANQAAGEENGTQGNQAQQSTEAAQPAGTTKESQDQDLDL